MQLLFFIMYNIFLKFSACLVNHQCNKSKSLYLQFSLFCVNTVSFSSLRRSRESILSNNNNFCLKKYSKFESWKHSRHNTPDPYFTIPLAKDFNCWSLIVRALFGLNILKAQFLYKYTRTNTSKSDIK